MMQTYFRPMIAGRLVTLLPIYGNYLLSVIWSYLILFSLGLGLLWSVGLGPPRPSPPFRLAPELFGLTLIFTYLTQAVVSDFLDTRYERGMFRSLFWVIWYPIAFWLLSAATTVAALPRVLTQPKKERTTWVSPDRGLR
jgi:biofilm PGA synthesis N-glycosyltransferase PgaC